MSPSARAAAVVARTAALLLLLTVLAVACARRAPPPPAALPPLRAAVARGVSYAHDWTGGGYGSAADAAQLRAVRELGASWVGVMPFAYARGAAASRIGAAYDSPRGENDAALAQTIARARAAGLRVLLKPHLWVAGSWPGALDPRDDATQRALLRDWTEVALHYAELAERTHADALAVGVEMDALAVARPDLWRALIARVRGVYRGTLVYCANWNRVADIAFWDALDVVGVQAYAPLAPAAGRVTRAEALSRAARVVAEYAAHGRRARRPVWLTELGFRGDADALREPWAWPEAGRRACDPAQQALGYEATFRALAQAPEITGVFLWKLFSSGGREDDGPCGFVFTAQPAERVVRAAFGR